MKKIKLIISIILVLCLFLFVGCDKDNNQENNTKPTNVERRDCGSLGYLFKEYDGFLYEDPSSIIVNNEIIVTYTTNKTKDDESTCIAIRKGQVTATGYTFDDNFTIAIEGSDGWDRYNVCNSDIICGKYTYNDVEYKYVLAYQASRFKSKKRFQIGLAVSNDLVTWTRVGTEPFISFDYELLGDTDGVCNPSLVDINGNGNVMLFYSYASSRITESRFIEIKMSNLSNVVKSGSISVAHDGLEKDGLEWATVVNADFAYDKTNDEIYMVRDSMIYASQNAKESTLVYVSKIKRLDLYKQQATWTNIASLGGLENGGYTRFHSASIITNGSSQLLSSDVKILCTSSVAASGLNDDSYIFKSGIHLVQV